MKNLSAVIVVKNEERNIEKCLNSIKDIADEIIIVDDYSTDNTVDICCRYTDKIYQHKWEGFGLQKQYNHHCM